MTSPSVKLLRTQTDERLVALASAGHERAFEAIVERYRRPLLRHCRRYLPEARAEDALQQALVSAWSALRRGDEVRALRPWLHRIVHNTSLNALRAAGYDYDQLKDTLHGSGGPAEPAERSAVVRQTLAGLAALPERQREALLKIAVEGRSQDEVAADLGLSRGAVRQLVHRARTSLRAAATAVVPLPLAVWLASAGGDRGDLAARIGELAAGAGGGATLAKAGAVAALAGTAVGTPAAIDRLDERPGGPVRPTVIAASARAAGDGASERGRRDVAPGAAGVPVAAAPRADRSGRRDGDGTDRSGRRGGEAGDDDRSGPGPGDPGESHDRSGDGGSSGSGSSGSGTSGSGSSGSESSGSDSSGSDAPRPDPSGSESFGSEPVEPDTSGSGSSGSGSG